MNHTYTIVACFFISSAPFFSMDPNYQPIPLRPIPSPLLEYNSQGKVEKIVEYKWCPNPYSDGCYNQGRCGLCFANGLTSCAICSGRMIRMYEQYFNGNDVSAPCTQTHTCQQVWCIPSETATTVFFALTSFLTVYSWMPCHDKDGCCPYKKTITNVRVHVDEDDDDDN